jgi:hypothetical protein
MPQLASRSPPPQPTRAQASVPVLSPEWSEQAETLNRIATIADMVGGHM